MADNLSKLDDPKKVTEQLKKDIIKLVIDEVVIEGEKLKIAATIPLPNKVHEWEIAKTDLPDTFNAGATLGPINQTKMERIWTKHKQINTTLKPKVFVGMSGGVDSSVAAALLKKRGYNVVGVHLRCYNLDGCADQDLEDARRAAETLNIPFYVFDFEKEYKKRVVEYMVDGYRRGITPNPDVECNREIKFGLFLKKALELGADYVATGHYVRLREVKNQKSKIKNYVLAAARDLNKDQSYFLWTLTQEQLKHCLFPIGEYTKPQVRALARKFGLPNADKKDSQGICFLGKITLADFLKKRIPTRRGAIVTTTGEVLGEHEGAQFYTIGQRHIGLANRRPARTGCGLTPKENIKPVYVAGKNVRTNTLTVAEGNDNPALCQNEVELMSVNFIKPITSLIRANGSIGVLARVRYRQLLAKAVLSCQLQATSYKLKFHQPVKFVAPGQSAVFYSKRGEMLGGGVIV